MFVHPVTGVPVATDAYTPTRQQRRYLRNRDQVCRWPGCAASAHRADLDHTVDHAFGGETRLDNLAHLCRSHHVTKHATSWTLRQHPGGVIAFTSPHGRTFSTRPEPIPGYGPDAPPGGVLDPTNWTLVSVSPGADPPGF